MEPTVVQRMLEPLSTTWVRKVTGVSRQTVSNWRHGRHEPPIEKWDRLLDALVECFPKAER